MGYPPEGNSPEGDSPVSIVRESQKGSYEFEKIAGREFSLAPTFGTPDHCTYKSCNDLSILIKLNLRSFRVQVGSNDIEC